MNFQALLATVIMLLATVTNSAKLVPIPSCPTSCGNLTIPFPFGTSCDCSLDHSFLISCNHDYNPPKPFLNWGPIEVLDISLDGLMRVASSIASECYHSSGSRISGTISELTLSKFQISSTRNKFMAVGCDTHALFQGSQDWKQMNSGCISWCDGIDRLVSESCSGIGCCQASIPKGVKDFHVDIRSFKNHTRVNTFNPCGYAFVVETEAYEFSSSDLMDLQKIKTVPVVLDWSVGNFSCEEARKDIWSFACRATHSECVDLSSGAGYQCKCLTGFPGNPYLVDGCQDIDECSAMGFESDGGSCRPQRKVGGSLLFYIAWGLMIPAVGSIWIFWRREQKKDAERIRQQLFARNGGQFLRALLCHTDTLTVFSAQDLDEATDNYNKNNVISANGTNYKGRLPNGQRITITECGAVEECNIQDFIRNVIHLSRYKHPDMVSLLGCCLETPLPQLVYEFSDLQTLDDCIHDDDRAHSLSWDIRLRIAAETARALERVHSDAFPVILNSSSILLHHDYTVKLHYKCAFSDSPAVHHFHVDKLGYLEPEYFVINRLTKKSDVYSFGVVLAELLTGKKAIISDEQYLAQFFVSENRGGNLDSILDHRLKIDEKIDQLKEVGKLAEWCLSDSSADRPTIAQVLRQAQMNATLPPPPPSVGGAASLMRPPPLLLNKGISSLGGSSLSKNGNEQVEFKPLHWDKVKTNVEPSMVWDKIDKEDAFKFDGDLMEALFGYVATNRKSAKREGRSTSPLGENSGPPSKFLILETGKSQSTAIAGQGLNEDTIEKVTKIEPMYSSNRLWSTRRNVANRYSFFQRKEKQV